MLKRPTPFSADNKPPRGLKPVSHLPARFCPDAISTALFGSFVKVIYKSLHNCSLQSRLQGPARPFQTADHARCLIRMLQIVFFRFMLQWLWPTLQYNGTRLHQFQETAECVICEMQRITLPVWKLALIFSQSLPSSRGWCWLDLRSGLIPHGNGCMNSPYPQHSQAHRDFWPCSEFSWCGCAAGLTPGLAPTSVTYQLAALGLFGFFLPKNSTNNSCLYRPDCHWRSLSSQRQRGRHKGKFHCLILDAKNYLLLDPNLACKQVWNSCQQCPSQEGWTRLLSISTQTKRANATRPSPSIWTANKWGEEGSRHGSRDGTPQTELLWLQLLHASKPPRNPGYKSRIPHQPFTWGPHLRVELKNSQHHINVLDMNPGH